MAKKKRRKYGKLLGLLYLVVSAILIYALSLNIIRVIEQKNHYDALSAQREKLLEEKKTLSKEVELLADDDYVTRYARDNYIFSKDGEEVVKLPESKK